MCDPATAGLIISAVSGGVAAKSNADAFKRQDKEAARGIISQSKSQSESNALVNELVDKIGANTGQTERAAALDDFQGALRSGRETTEGSQQDVVGASDRFAERVGTGRESVRSEGNVQAERLSIIDGILRQRIGEGQDINRTAGDINRVKGDISAEDFLTRLRVAGQRPSQGINFLAGVGQGVGGGLSQRIPAATTAGSIANAGPLIIGEAGVPIGGAGAVNPFGG